ncbi:MAG: alpha/beta fold hydrolase [Candidatus Woesearchaeota archaeon]|nr:alpha/beta fold hydrolase [Candidatus Woesearchaeota archaeon]
MHTIIYAHGFGGGNDFPFVQKLEKDGNIVVQVILPGDPESGKPFSFLQSIKDILAEIKKEDEPVIGCGFSMGALFLLNIAREYPHLFSKLILINPVVDATYLQTDMMRALFNATSMQLHDGTFYGHEIEHMVAERNPMTFREQLTVPTQIFQAQQDEFLDPSVTKQFYEQLLGKKQYTELDGTHNAWGSEEQIQKALSGPSL